MNELRTLCDKYAGSDVYITSVLPGTHQQGSEKTLSFDKSLKEAFEEDNVTDVLEFGPSLYSCTVPIFGF